jgi:flagellar hook-associated protein 2
VATISSPGIGSSLDVASIVSKLMDAESAPLTQLQNKTSSYQAKLTSIGQLKSALSDLQVAAQTLNLSSTFSALTPSVSDSSVLSAAMTGATPAGSYNIEVEQLAQAQKLTSTVFEKQDSVVGNGTLTLDFGQYSDAGSPPVTFTANADNSTTTITIDSSNNTLTGIRDAINKSGAPVTATIINDGSGYRLSLTSKQSGTDNSIRLTVAESGTAGLSQLAYDGSDGGVANMTQNVAAADAKLKIDGIAVTKPSNTITDAIQGVTLNLSKTTAAGETTKLTLTPDTDSVKTALQSFVDAYNKLAQQLSTSTAYDATTNTASVLTGDSTVRTVQSQIRNALANAVSGAPAGMKTLSDIGISFQDDGTLSLDSDKLDKVLADPTADISKLFTTSADGKTVGYGSRLNTLISGMIFGDDSLLNSRIDGINSTIKDLANQETDEQARLDAIEQRYNTEFSALDTTIASMTTTSTFLTQQLALIAAQTPSTSSSSS